MAPAIDRKAGQVRVLSDLSGRVVGALIDDAENGSEGDAFMDALRRYRVDGAPAIGLWRGLAAGINEGRAAQILRHLTRDLLKGLSIAARDDDAPTDTAQATELAPVNVRPIDAARDVPALELASDGMWKPSGSALAAQEEVDASALRRNVPSARSRYPQPERGDRVSLPPAPKRFTEVTAAPVTKALAITPVAEPAPVTDAAPAANAAPIAALPILAAPIERESVIRAVAGGVEVVAGPFARFQQLATFVKAVRALSGVQDVTTRQFVRGMVHLRVRHAQNVGLADSLLELTDFSPEVVSSTQDRIELKVDIAE